VGPWGFMYFAASRIVMGTRGAAFRDSPTPPMTFPRSGVTPILEAVLSRKAAFGLIALAVVSAFVAGCGMSSSPATHGEQLFKTCAPCHGAQGQGSVVLRTPAIAGLPDWYLKAELTKFQKNIRGAHPDDNEGHRMRPMARSLYHKGDVDAVANYVSKMKPVWVRPMVKGDAIAGATRYNSTCIACHGPEGKGMQALGAPPLAGQADWYMEEQLAKFKTGMRGAHPEDNTGTLMKAIANTIPDTLAMRDVVAYVKTLPH
jgi:cytochrome c oxidase subunit 2